MNIGGIIAGIVLLIGGVVLIGIGAVAFVQSKSFIWIIVYGIIALALGLYIVFHLKKEDEIEKVKHK